jgi:hypothetical protein
VDAAKGGLIADMFVGIGLAADYRARLSLLSSNLCKRPAVCDSSRSISKRGERNMKFAPAPNKLEAVCRISDLTQSGPEILGPGSKEHKSVLINLAIGLGIPFSHEFTKQQLAAHIATALGYRWIPEFESVGQTITLSGLNLLLEAATHALELNPDRVVKTVGAAFEEELQAIATVVKANTPLLMNGKECVEEMKALGDPNWKQVQWQGFYFEMKAASALTSHLGGGRQKLFNTSFDYVRNFIWDLKAHSSENEAGAPTASCILNDSRAIEQAVEETGLGFIILTGKPTYNYEFTKWHKAFRGGGDGDPGRTLKSHFESQTLDIFFVPNSERLSIARVRKELTVNAQGKNSNNKPRPPKYSIDLKRALGSDLQVYSHSFV